MGKLICTVLGCCGIYLCSAQKIPPQLDPRNYPNGTAILLGSELLIRAADISEYDVLDTARYVLAYNFTNPYGVKGSDDEGVETMILEIGRSRTAFYSRDLFVDDSLYTYKILKQGRNETYPSNGIRFQIFGDIPKRRLEVVQRIPFYSGVAVVISDSPMPQWQVDTLSCDISGHKCFRARTVFSGRIWTAWFTPEIPLAVGPWKLWGLPGLILKAEDSQHIFSFECTSIEEKPGIIKKYKWRYSTMPHKGWLKLEARMHQTPYTMFGQNTLIIGLGPNPGRKDETWTVPYVPIEPE